MKATIVVPFSLEAMARSRAFRQAVAAEMEAARAEGATGGEVHFDVPTQPEADSAEGDNWKGSA